MRARSIARNASVVDAVNLPDVGRMSRQEFRQLEDALYGRRSLSDSGGGSLSSSASAPSLTRPSRPAPSSTNLASSAGRVSRQALAGSDSADRRVIGRTSGPLAHARGPQELARASAAEAPASREPLASADFAASRTSEQELRRLLELDGPSRQTGPSGRFRAASSSGPTAAGQPSAGAASRDDASPQSSTPSQTRQVVNRPRRSPAEDTVFIPDVGQMSRQELQRLEAVLNGSTDVGSELADLPDLSGMDAHQLSSIEVALSDGTLGDTMRASRQFGIRRGPGEAANSEHGHASRVTESPPSRHQERRGQQQHHQSRPLSPERSSTAAAGRGSLDGANNNASENAASQAAAPGQRWRVDDEAFKKLAIAKKDVPLDQECAICYQPVKDDAVALPCAKQSCASLFHSSCIHPWLERNPSCPLCRCELKELVTPIAPTCQGCGGPSASLDALLTAMGLAELLGHERATAWLFRQQASSNDGSRAGFPASVMAALTGSQAADPPAIMGALAAILQGGAADAGTVFVVPTEGARSLLDAADLAQTVGHIGMNRSLGHLGLGGQQWQTAADILGVSSSSNTGRNEQTQGSGRPSRDVRGDASAHMLGERSASEAERDRGLAELPSSMERREEQLANASISHGVTRRTSFGQTAPPGRFFATPSSASPSNANARSAAQMQRTRPSQIALRLPPAVNSTETDSASSWAARSTRGTSPAGGGWRPTSRGSSRAQASSIPFGSRSSSVPQLASGAGSVARVRAAMTQD